uniref:Uncharacterized protein n=1 Tax=Hyaloperonospora arabidopsidis (strain Emoy2) TaxID=559515 RepID=M4C0U2_HYAAE
MLTRCTYVPNLDKRKGLPFTKQQEWQNARGMEHAAEEAEKGAWKVNTCRSFRHLRTARRTRR